MGQLNLIFLSHFKEYHMQEECRLCVLDKQLGRHPADADPALIEEYQNAVREITGREQLSAPEATEPKTLDVELTQAQKETNARNVLAALEAF